MVIFITAKFQNTVPMKYFSILFVVAALFVSGSSLAQSSRLNGKTFTYVMNTTDGMGEMIEDRLVFSNNTMSSDRYTVTAKTRQGKVAEKAAGETSTFETTVTGSNNETVTYKCTVEGNYIHGTVEIKDASGNITEMVMRGMTIEEYEKARRMKEEYRKNNQ